MNKQNPEGEVNTMKLRERYALEIQSIWQDVETLKNGQIYELDRVPGVPRCSTVGQNLEKKLSALLSKIEQDVEGSIETAAKIIQNME